MDAFPVPEQYRTTHETHEAADLHARWQQAQERISDLEAQRDAARADVARLDDELRATLNAAAMRGEDASTTSLEKQLRSAREKAAQPWDARINAARQAADAMGRKYHAHVEQNFEALHDELEPAAQQARQRVIDAVDALADAFTALRAVHSATEELTLSASHLDPRDVGIAPSRPGRRSYHAADRRITDPTPEMRRRIADDLDGALPLPVVRQQALDYRRDKLAGKPVKPARPLTALETRV